MPNGNGTSREKRQISALRYPYYDLATCLEIVRRVFQEKGGSTTKEGLAETLGTSTEKSTFAQKVNACVLFGLLRSQGSLLEVADLALRIIKFRDERDRARAYAEAFLSVPLYARVQEKFSGRPLPPETGLKNVLDTEFGVIPKRVDEAYRIMMLSARHAGLITVSDGNTYMSKGPSAEVQPQPAEELHKPSGISETLRLEAAGGPFPENLITSRKPSGISETLRATDEQKDLERERISRFSSVRRWLISYPALILAGVGVGTALFFVTLGRPQVALVRMSDVVFGRETSAEIVRMLRYAQDSPSIKAVVVEIDSLGGEVSSVEEVYLHMLRLRQTKPVVAYINVWGVSGGYYVASAANYIYAKPSSHLGNVGAQALASPPDEPSEVILPSGPFKTTGGATREAIKRVEIIKGSFIQAVFLQRGDRLKITKEELSLGKVYLGVEALRQGLVDVIGSSSDAIDRAVELAGLSSFEVVDINERLGVDISGGSLFLGSSPSRPTAYFLYPQPRP